MVNAFPPQTSSIRLMDPVGNGKSVRLLLAHLTESILKKPDKLSVLISQLEQSNKLRDVGDDPTMSSLILVLLLHFTDVRAVLKLEDRSKDDRSQSEQFNSARP